MEVFNKIYSQVSSSVSSTVSQLSGVLPGNPVTREFDATVHIASAGPGLLWKIYKGSKKSTKQEASIFVFEKRQLDKFNKTDREIILETLRKGITQLTKIRHPRVLTVQHPLEESRESLAFATEPIFASLANVLGQTNNMPQPSNMSDYKFFDIEIKYGLLQIGEGLAFLHNDVKLFHKNISPESIVINSQGAWKIFGFDFCIHNTSPGNNSPIYPFEEYVASLPAVARPNLNYLSPECILSNCHSTSADMFALGMVIYTVTAPTKRCLMPVKDVAEFKTRAQKLKNLGPLDSIPTELRDTVRSLLAYNAESRMDAHQFTKISYFQDIGIKTLSYLDSLLQWDNVQKSQFYKGLPEALQKLPHRVRVQQVLPCLVRDLTQPVMIPFILPSILDIAQDCTQSEYCSSILPHLKPVMKLIEPVQILLIFLQRMELLLKLTPAEDIQQHVLPMLYRGLDSNSPQIHELCLSVLPTFAGLLDHANVKNSLLPRIKKLCISTTTLSVRVNCLVCIGKLLEHLDKWLVLDEILPFLPQISSRDPAVIMGILGIYKLAMTHKKLGISKEIMASRVLPFLIPLCIENGLTIPQFNALVTLVKDMFNLVESEHRTKLEQLNSIKDEQKVLTANMPNIKPNNTDLNSAFNALNMGVDISKTNPEPKVKELSSPPKIEPIKPIPAAPKKDLGLLDDWSPKSSTTISKANNISTNASFSNTTYNLSSPVNNFNTSNNSMGFQQNNMWLNSKPQYPTNTPTTQMHFNQFSSFQSAPVSNFNSNAVSSNNNNQNWSALDSLLPQTSSAPNKLPMNLMSTNQPLIPPPNITNNNSNNNSLSNDEILDFLR